ncbi:unnamed protein product, partial [Prorocentrum cordatum]
MPADIARAASLAESCAEAGGAAQPDLLELAELAPQPDDWTVGVLLRPVAFAALAAQGGPRCFAADERDGEGARGDEVDAVREAATQERAGGPRGACAAGNADARRERCASRALGANGPARQ